MAPPASVEMTTKCRPNRGQQRVDKNKIAAHRAFLKDTLRLQIDFRQTDQNLGKAPPALQKPLLSEEMEDNENGDGEKKQESRRIGETQWTNTPRLR